MLLAAVALIDQNNLRHLKMRNLGDHLGVEALSLYRYVHSREDLLDGIVELVIDDLYGIPQGPREATPLRITQLTHLNPFPRPADRPQRFPLHTHPNAERRMS